MAGRYLFSTHTIGHLKELIELDEVVAQSARNGCSAFQIILYERFDNRFFKALLEIDNVIGYAQQGSHITCVVDVVERAATPNRSPFRLKLRETPLVPQLHCHSDDVLTLPLQ